MNRAGGDLALESLLNLFEDRAAVRLVGEADQRQQNCLLEGSEHVRHWCLLCRLCDPESTSGEINVAISLQIAATFVLLVAVGLTTRSFVNLQRTNPGFNPEGRLSIQLSLPPTRYGTARAIGIFADRLKPRLARIPTVEDAAAVSLLPLSGLLRTEDFRIVGRPEPPSDEIPQAHFRIVMPRYFTTLGITIVVGREFTDDDREGTARVAVIGRSLADRVSPGASPIGAHVPLRQMPAGDAPFVAARMYWVVRTSSDPSAIATAVRREIQAIDGDIATSSAVSLDQVLTVTLGARRFNVTLLGLFGHIALMLAAVGVYAVTAFAVGRRTREIGIRIAFGATRRDVIRLILASELPAVTGGVLTGAVVALLVTRVMTRTLFQVAAFDAWTFATVSVALAITGAVATYLPARRAVGLDPTVALRTP